MIDHIINLTEGIVNGTIKGGDLFRVHKEIYRELQGISANQFAQNHQIEFTMARGMFEHLSYPNAHEVIDGTKVMNAAKRLRPVLDHYLDPKPTTPQVPTHFNFTTIGGTNHMGDKINITGNVTGSAVGSHATLKARDIVTQIRQSGLLGEDIQKAFADAAEALDALEASDGTKEDVADDLEKLKKELEKPTKDDGRIKTIWDRINSVASTVATALSAAATIASIVLAAK